MQVFENRHLTYCTNIHPGETWEEVLNSLENTLVVKKKLCPKQSMGIGLRLSAQASEQLGIGTKLQEFKEWLTRHDCYVFTMNGFPYGGFHGEVVKDKVHAPDWTTKDRVTYTKRLFNQLALLLPNNMIEGGISTSPISYRHWHKTDLALKKVIEEGALNILKIVVHLVQIRANTGKLLHLDIEPEPDGILENSQEFINFFEEVLLVKGIPFLQQQLGFGEEMAKQAILDHIQLCYDVCHFAVEYESPKPILQRIKEKGIKVGKIQISAAIKTNLAVADTEVQKIKDALNPYNESTYLHQTVFKTKEGTIKQFSDLGQALDTIPHPDYIELRTHFHVPIFAKKYGYLQSTQDEIVEVLQLWKATEFSNHLEVETYTWDVLPDNNQLGLTDSIYRELAWVVQMIQ